MAVALEDWPGMAVWYSVTTWVMPSFIRMRLSASTSTCQRGLPLRLRLVFQIGMRRTSTSWPSSKMARPPFRPGSIAISFISWPS